jgi:predicted RNA-binding Zn ribbon-like protein
MRAPFSLLASDPTLDFVNTLDNRFVDSGPSELLQSYEDLLRFVEQAGVLEKHFLPALARIKNSPAASRALASSLELREALAEVLYAGLTNDTPHLKSLKILEHHFLTSEAHTELVWKSSADESLTPLEWDWGRFAKDPNLPVWALGQFASRLLTSSSMAHIRMCQSDTCRWLFLDTSKNHTRRWCDMRVCGNRMKARRFNARRHSAA